VFSFRGVFLIFDRFLVPETYCYQLSSLNFRRLKVDVASWSRPVAIKASTAHISGESAVRAMAYWFLTATFLGADGHHTPSTGDWYN